MESLMDQRAAAIDLAREVSRSCLGTRVARLHRLVTRSYEQALQAVGLSQPQMEVLACLVNVGGPIKPSDLAAKLLLDRSSVSRNLALMQRNGWVGVAETSATGRAMSVTITDAGVAVFTSAGAAWCRVQADMAEMLGPGAIRILD